MAVDSYPTVDEAYSKVTFALGVALTQWQSVELKLYQLFIFLSGSSDQRAIGVIFHEMPLEVRLRSLTELVRLRNEAMIPKWDATLKIVHKQRRFRDKLAHWTVCTAPHKDGGFTAWLTPPTTDDRARVVYENLQNAMGANDLTAKSLEFGVAAHSIHVFMHEFPDFA